MIFLFQEKQNTIPDELGKDAKTVAALQWRHATFENDLMTLGTQVCVVASFKGAFSANVDAGKARRDTKITIAGSKRPRRCRKITGGLLWRQSKRNSRQRSRGRERLAQPPDQHGIQEKSTGRHCRPVPILQPCQRSDAVDGRHGQADDDARETQVLTTKRICPAFCQVCSDF